MSLLIETLTVCHSGAAEVEQALMKNLFIGYNLKVRPARSPEERVVVRVGMILSSFVGLVRIIAQLKNMHLHVYTPNCQN